MKNWDSYDNSSSPDDSEHRRYPKEKKSVDPESVEHNYGSTPMPNTESEASTTQSDLEAAKGEAQVI